MGSAIEKPLNYYLDAGMDAIFYYHVYQLNVEKQFKKINLFNSTTIDEYLKCLVISDRFKHFVKQLFMDCTFFVNELL